MSENREEMLRKAATLITKPGEITTTPEGRQEVARQIGFTRSEAEQYYQRGLASFEDGDLENAILDLNEAIHYDRKHAELYSTRGLFHLENGDEEAAEIDLNYALKLSKRQWLAHYVLGMMDFRHGDYDEALKHFSEAHKIAPRRPEVLFYRGVTYHYLNDDDKAAQDMERAETMFPDNDKRRKDAAAWTKEIKKSITDKPKPSGPPPLNRPDQPQLGSGTSPRR
jgi:Flp pilus assembly protein TadD